MIHMNGVTKYFPTINGRKYVLRNINLYFPEFVNIGVLGLNGSGKSTLLRIISGVDSPSSGTVKLNGTLSWPMGLSDGVQASLTGRQNAQFVCRVYGDCENTVSDKLDFIREFSELGDYFDMPVKTYSSGMKSRLKFSISMAFDFDVYLFDEINAVGDARFREKSRAALKERKHQSNYIIVSHRANDLVKDCDVIAVLDKCQINIFDDVMAGIKYYNQNVVKTN